jgi:hypothetical protein
MEKMEKESLEMFEIIENELEKRFSDEHGDIEASMGEQLDYLMSMVDENGYKLFPTTDILEYFIEWQKEFGEMYDLFEAYCHSKEEEKK